MRLLHVFLLAGSFAIAVAENDGFRLLFPPFDTEATRTPAQPLPDNISSDELQTMSIEERRGVMTIGKSSVQIMAARQLLELGDQETVLRLVYSLKQGNVSAIGTLRASTLAVIPYLMEDVAHGSLDYYGSYIFGDGVIEGGRVRGAAMECAASVLFRAEEFTGETRECLRAIISKGNSRYVQGFSDQSRYLVEWWLLNKDAFEAGRWEDTRPLPYEITYLDPRQDALFSPDEGWNKEKQPPFGSPAWEIPESFEAWAERIVDPKRRRFDFVSLSWDGTKVVEHPAKSLDPRVRPSPVQDRESRKTPILRNPSDPDSGSGRTGFLWMGVAVVALVVLLIAQWAKRRA